MCICVYPALHGFCLSGEPRLTDVVTMNAGILVFPPCGGTGLSSALWDQTQHGKEKLGLGALAVQGPLLPAHSSVVSGTLSDLL